MGKRLLTQGGSQLAALLAPQQGVAPNPGCERMSTSNCETAPPCLGEVGLNPGHADSRVREGEGDQSVV